MLGRLGCVGQMAVEVEALKCIGPRFASILGIFR